MRRNCSDNRGHLTFSVFAIRSSNLPMTISSFVSTCFAIFVSQTVHYPLRASGKNVRSFEVLTNWGGFGRTDGLPERVPPNAALCEPRPEFPGSWSLLSAVRSADRGLGQETGLTRPDHPPQPPQLRPRPPRLKRQRAARRG